MTLLLVGDTHFTISELDEYRWKIFSILKELVNDKNDKVDMIIFMGDLVDLKDKHSAKLVNRLIDELSDLKFESKSEVSIIAGNHDKPLEGPYYWQFLSRIGVPYITKPEKISIGTFEQINIWLLPYSHSPIEDWSELKIRSDDVVLMHQTVQGAVIENDRVLESFHKLPKLSTKYIFSGDVHRPQKVGDVVYVGTPYPIKFSEMWENRLILIRNSNFENPIDVWLNTTRRAILSIRSSEQVKDFSFPSGSQIKIKYILSGENLTNLPIEEQIVRKWASDSGIKLVSFEPELEGKGVEVKHNEVELMKPAEIIREYGKSEKLSEDIIETGIQLLEGI